MTKAEREEAERLLVNGILHARMLPLLRAALESKRPEPVYVEHSSGSWSWMVWGKGAFGSCVIAHGWQTFPSKEEAERYYKKVVGE